MSPSVLKIILISSLLAVASAGYAQDQDLGKVDLEAIELSNDVIGAPVSDRTGAEIGQVADISFDEDGQPDRLRVRVSAHLGFGERTVELSRDTFILLQGHVVAELSSDELRALPDLGDENDERRAD